MATTTGPITPTEYILTTTSSCAAESQQTKGLKKGNKCSQPVSRQCITDHCRPLPGYLGRGRDIGVRDGRSSPNVPLDSHKCPKRREGQCDESSECSGLKGECREKDLRQRARDLLTNHQVSSTPVPSISLWDGDALIHLYTTEIFERQSLNS
jgi:hypothetical protein